MAAMNIQMLTHGLMLRGVSGLMAVYLAVIRNSNTTITTRAQTMARVFLT